MIIKKRLIILDIDHTLIYGSYAESENAKLLFQYNRYLKVYERPFAREFIAGCKELGDIIVYTTAIHDYANKICGLLDIHPLQLIARENDAEMNPDYKKKLFPKWLKSYSRITIVDDTPNIWDNHAHENASFIIPPEFRGDKSDSFFKQLIKTRFVI